MTAQSWVLPSITFQRAYTPREAALAKAVQPQAMAALGKDHVFINIHNYSFPDTSNDFNGVGSPYSQGAHDFFTFARNEGFNGVLFAPQGYIRPGDISPYGANFFSRSTLGIDLKALADDPQWLGLLSKANYMALRRAHKLPETPPKHLATQANYAKAFLFYDDVLRQAYQNFTEDKKRFKPIAKAFLAFKRENAAWLERDALFEVLNTKNPQWFTDQWPWLDRTLYAHDGVPALLRPAKKALSWVWKTWRKHQFRLEIDAYAFNQFIAFKQHADFLTQMKKSNFDVVGDIPISQSAADEWAYHDLFMKNYHMGAPPSLTGPTGQPWAFPLLDPAKYDRGGKAYLQKRIAFLSQRYSMLRIDHPHGYVDPWVYRHDFSKRILSAFDEPSVKEVFKLNTPNVQQGARLFSTLKSDKHASLKRFAKIKPNALNSDLDVKAYYDNWVKTLSDSDVKCYSELMDVIIETAKKQGLNTDKIIPEVLSTCPFPLYAVLEKHGLGRLRVIQKADPRPENKAHVYRSENARPQDWLMTSTHDAPSIWQMSHSWFAPSPGKTPDASKTLHAEYTAGLFYPVGSKDYQDLVKQLKANRGKMVQARVAGAFLSPGRHMIIPFNDLLGMETRINNPEEARIDNWTLRVPNDYKAQYTHALEQYSAINMPQALAMALAARLRNGTLEKTQAPLQRQLAYLGEVRALKTGDTQGQAALNARYADVIKALPAE